MSFAIRLKTLRKSYGLSRPLLANLLLVSTSSLSKYESGERTPDLHTLRKIASFFEVSTDYLLEMGSYHLENFEKSICVSVVKDKSALYTPNDAEYQWLIDMRSLSHDQSEIILKQLSIFKDFNARTGGKLSNYQNYRNQQRISGN